jgi:hypothetical protein
LLLFPYCQRPVLCHEQVSNPAAISDSSLLLSQVSYGINFTILPVDILFVTAFRAAAFIWEIMGLGDD